MDTYALAKVIGAKIKALGDIDLILAGKKWIDEESSQVPLQVAEELSIPQATLASKIEVDEGSKTAKVTSVIEGGERIVELKLPALITVEQGINEPRYASLPGIMKAKKNHAKKLEKETLMVMKLAFQRENLELMDQDTKMMQSKFLQ